MFHFFEQELILGMKKEDAQRFKKVVRETMNLVGFDVPTGYVRSVYAHVHCFVVLFLANNEIPHECVNVRVRKQPRCIHERVPESQVIAKKEVRENWQWHRTPTCS